MSRLDGFSSRTSHEESPLSADRWRERANEIVDDWSVIDNGDLDRLAPRLAALAKRAYREGMEEAARIADGYSDDSSVSAEIVDAIRERAKGER